MRKVNLLLLSCLLWPLMLSAQDFQIRRGNCMPDRDGSAGQQPRKALPSVNTNWDPERIYRQLVILISFAGDGTDFSTDDPKAAYDMLFNMNGYNQRDGKGCVAEYFRDQSEGLLNLQFDVYGPYRVSQSARLANANANSTNYGNAAMVEATKMLIQENPDMDFSVYDWNGDGRVNQVIYVHAGLSGNGASEAVYGYLWPNTSSFSTITTPDGKRISDYTASAELWPNNTSCGIGTICHEFSHSLGLPDIYPVPSWTFSAVDEWDLMDGGNFTNYGWCPPNYSPLEKMLLGWLQPVELTEPSTITEMKPVSEGGEVYQVKHTDTEYLLLENRQWNGWDYGAPGSGLVVYHVNYIASKWVANTVNGTSNAPFNYTLFHADNRDYNAWSKYIGEAGLGHYAYSPWLRSYYLSGSPYPYTTSEGEVINELTDTSVPATQMINENAGGSKLLSKPITNIQVADDGTVSFDFMGGNPSGISTTASQPSDGDSNVYNIMGQRVATPRKGLFIKNGKKYIKSFYY